MKRSRSPLKLRRSPLIMALAQIQISPVTKIATYVEDVQERLRREGFPRFEEGRVQELLLRPGMQPEIREHTRWEMQNKERTAGIVVMPNAVIVHTNQYDTFDHFASWIQLALEVIGEVVEPALVERLGLRYVDLVRPDTGESWTEYVRKELHGLSPAAVGMTSALQRHETFGATPVGQLVVRCTQTVDGSFLPPDLLPSTLDYSAIIVAAGELVTSLDLDHFSLATRDFNVGQIMEAMWDLHENLDLSFREAVTDVAMNKWEASPR